MSCMIRKALNKIIYCEIGGGGIILKVLLIDDELNALNYLEAMLKPHSDIQVMGKYTDAGAAIHQLGIERIDLIFLDIEMGFFHGIDIAEELVNLYPKLEIVFITAHSEFAVEAFELDAIDYLLKPVNATRLEETIRRVQERLSGDREKEHTLSNSNDKFFASTFGKFHLFDEKKNIVKWRTKKGRELVVLLWKNQDRPVDKEYIIETLWPEMPFDSAVILLYTTVYQVRKALRRKDKENPIKLVGEDYQLKISISSDYEELQQILSAPKIASNIQRSLELYQDNFLQEYDWVSSERFALENAFLHYLEECIFNNNNIIEPSLKESCLEKIIQVDPLNEKCVLELLSYYSESGNPVKMNALYREYKKELKELSLEVPSSFERYVEI